MSMHMGGTRRVQYLCKHHQCPQIYMGTETQSCADKVGRNTVKHFVSVYQFRLGHGAGTTMTQHTLIELGRTKGRTPAYDRSNTVAVAMKNQVRL